MYSGKVGGDDGVAKRDTRCVVAVAGKCDHRWLRKFSVRG